MKHSVIILLHTYNRLSGKVIIIAILFRFNRGRCTYLLMRLTLERLNLLDYRFPPSPK